MFKKILQQIQQKLIGKKNLIPSWINEVAQKYSTLFAQKVLHEVILPTEDALCAQISEESYHEVAQRKQQLESYHLADKYSTGSACVYVDEQAKRCIIWYRGTVVTDVHDIASDAQIVLDVQWIDPRVQEALHFYDTIKREFPGYAIWVCGHSLGWTFSYIVAKHRIPARCVVFNPGVSLNTFFVQMLEDTLRKKVWTQNTYTYKILGDIISTVAFVGHVKTFVIKADNPLALHLLINFLTHKTVET